MMNDGMWDCGNVGLWEAITVHANATFKPTLQWSDTSGAKPGWIEPRGTQGTSRGQIFRQSLRTFHCLSDLGLQKPKKMGPSIAPWACLEKEWVRTCSCLTLVRFWYRVSVSV